MVSKPTSVSPKGQVTIPAEIRKEFNIRPGDMIEFRVVNGLITAVPSLERVRELYGSAKPIEPVDDWKAAEREAFEEAAERTARAGLPDSDEE